MVLLSPLLLSLLYAPLLLAGPLSSPKTVHEKRAPKSNWNKHRRLDARAVLPVRIGLKQNNINNIADILYSVSDPASPKYGKHWTYPEIAAHFAPSEHTVSSVKDWLHAQGFSPERVKQSASKGWLTFEASAAEIEQLLDTEFHVYKHTDGTEHIGCDQYSVPTHLSDHIDLITPTVNFVRKRSINPVKKRASDILSPKHILKGGPKTNGHTLAAAALPHGTTTCDEFITLDCLRALYNINRTPTQVDKNTFAVVEFTPQSYVQSDLDAFFREYVPSLPNGTAPILVSIDGGQPTPNDVFDFNTNGESDLDFEYAMGLTAPQPVQLYQTGDDVEGASFNNYLDAIDGSFCTFEGGDDPNFDGIYPDPLPGGFKGPASCGIVPPANVISVSYGAQEIELTAAYQERECAEHAKLGLAGVSILYSSGDNGVAGFGALCVDDEGNETANGTHFNPGFPVTCPFVTAVGGTQVDPGSTVNDPEGACEQVIFSGGGFSNIFPIPDYQKSQVASFFANFPPSYTAAQFNNSQTVRGYPDLSANAANYVIAIDNEFALVFGTSASAPTTASMLTLVNDARIEAGKGPIGFINPAIYSDAFANVFNDITHGTNQGCGTVGFTAVPGWDPVTGLGTPDFPKLLAAFMALP